MADRPAEAGFTLVETVTALGIFSLAALGLLHVSSENARALAALQTSAYGRMIAQNQLVFAMANPSAPRPGENRGDLDFAGREWVWVQRTETTPDPDMLKITVAVSQGGAEQTAPLSERPVVAEMTAYWGPR